jgi:hypothetical protein
MLEVATEAAFTEFQVQLVANNKHGLNFLQCRLLL